MRLTNAPKGAWPDLRRSRVLGMTLPDTAQPPLAATTRNTDRPVPGILPAVCARCHDKLRHHVRPALISLCPVMESNMIWSMTDRPRVTVLGSLNMDISVTVPRLPEPGATVLGSAARFTPGGKGANQAVAAARLGAAVRMVGCVGDDDFGRQLLAALRAENVDAAGVRTVPGVPTGLAMISVDAAGENLITVAPGANHEVGAGEVAAAAGSPADVLVICAEIPVPAIRTALAWASGARARCVLNLAPVPPEAAAIVAEMGEGLDWLVVNESEAGAVLNRRVDGLAEASQAAAALVAAGIPAAEAVRAAAAAGAAAATRPGAQAGMPRPADILAVTGVSWPAG